MKKDDIGYSSKKPGVRRGVGRSFYISTSDSEWIDKMVESRQYVSPTHLIRAAIRALQEKERRAAKKGPQ